MQKDVYEFISKEANDPIIAWETCPQTGKAFALFQGDQTARDKVSPVVGGTKYPFPLPIRSRHARLAQKLAMRNNRNLYRRTCGLTDKPIISLYHPESPFMVYSHEAWYSDEWDAMDYALEPDLEQSILGQLQQLSDQVPKLTALVGASCQRCTYATGVIDSQNCYLSDTCSYSEDLRYSSFVLYCERIMDCYKCDHLSNSYMSVWCQNSSHLQYCVDVTDSSYCWYSVSLKNCSHCFGCSNLVNKSYCFFNEQLDKETYHEKVAVYDLGSSSIRDQLRTTFIEIVIPGTIFRATGNTNVENCIGDGLNNCKDIFLGFELLEMQEARYTTDGPPKNSTCIDAAYVVNAEMVYNSFSAIGTGIYCCAFTWNCSDIFYSKLCQNCHHVFGCVGLQNKQYCIFNKQYEKETYITTVQQIIETMRIQGERGDFPYTPDFGYNETVAHEYFPLSKEEALARGYTRQDTSYPVNIPENASILEDVPDHIDDVDDAITGQILLCQQTQKPYRIIRSELDFYKQNNIPLPRIHQDVRYIMNKQYIPARNFYIRPCDKTGENMLSVFPEGVPFNVYNQQAYDDFMYG